MRKSVRLFFRRKTETKGKADVAAEPVARVRIDSRTYPVSQLDHTSLKVDGYSGDLIAHQRFHFTFQFDLDGEAVEVPTRGAVLSTEGGTLLARYFAPQPYYQKLMRRALAAKVA